jgi:hypothetical protein
MPRAVLLGGLDEALDLPVGEIFTAALANCYIYAVEAASRSREFSMETALPPIHTVTDLLGRVTDLDGCSSPAPPDIAGARPLPDMRSSGILQRNLIDTHFAGPAVGVVVSLGEGNATPRYFLAGRGIGLTPTCSSAVYGAP